MIWRRTRNQPPVTEFDLAARRAASSFPTWRKMTALWTALKRPLFFVGLTLVALAIDILLLKIIF